MTFKPRVHKCLGQWRAHVGAKSFEYVVHDSWRAALDTANRYARKPGPWLMRRPSPDAIIRDTFATTGPLGAEWVDATIGGWGSIVSREDFLRHCCGPVTSFTVTDIDGAVYRLDGLLGGDQMWVERSVDGVPVIRIERAGETFTRQMERVTDVE